MERFGYYDDDRKGYPLAAWIWGHRLIQGQHWMEYLLEFLNVFVGFDYELGQGINKGTSTPSSKPEGYEKFTRVGLRRFVFYDEREKTQHAFDTEALKRLKEVLLAEKMVSAGRNEETVLESVRRLLRSFAAIEETRSWYAKTLFPAHHNFLFWEARRNTKAARKAAQQDPTDADASKLDSILAYDGRNFFARGGELYYLILSAGTQASQERRKLIVERLEYLLTGHNQALGRLANLIDQTWEDKLDESNGNKNALTGKLGWIPDPDCALYKVIASDIENFLRADLDQLEALTLFAHLICFHLTLYIYHRAHPEATSEQHQAEAGTCLDECRLALLIDALEGADGGVVRRVSAALFRTQEERIKQKGKEYIHQQVQEWMNKPGKNGADILVAVSSEARHHFNERAWGKSLKNQFTAEEDGLLTQYHEGKLTLATFSEKYADTLFEILNKNFRSNFLGVHRKLSKGIGFVAPRTGTGARYILGNNMLKALTLAILPPGSRITYDRFLALLYEQYGLVVGPIEAKQSGLFERQRINSEYYERNKAALLAKLKFAGLAIEYSDATAMVGLIDS